MLVVRQISLLHTSLAPLRLRSGQALDGCPMFADFRVHGLNKMGDPDFLYAAPDMTACAAFSKESRMKFANATKLHRKSGGSPSFFFPVVGVDGGESIGKTSCSTHVRESPRTWGTRPEPALSGVEGGQGLVGSRKTGGRNDHPRTERRSFISLLTRASQLLGMRSSAT